MIEGLLEQAQSLKAFKEKLMSTAIDGAMGIKDVVARMKSESKQGRIKLIIKCEGTRGSDDEQIEWTVWDAVEWRNESEKSGQGPSLVDAYKQWSAKSIKKGTVESVAEELKS